MSTEESEAKWLQQKETNKRVIFWITEPTVRKQRDSSEGAVEGSRMRIITSAICSQFSRFIEEPFLTTHFFSFGLLFFSL